MPRNRVAHVPASESSFLARGIHKATCSCGWQSVATYDSEAKAFAAAQKHARNANEKERASK